MPNVIIRSETGERLVVDGRPVERERLCAMCDRPLADGYHKITEVESGIFCHDLEDRDENYLHPATERPIYHACAAAFDEKYAAHYAFLSKTPHGAGFGMDAFLQYWRTPRADRQAFMDRLRELDREQTEARKTREIQAKIKADEAERESGKAVVSMTPRPKATKK